MCRAVRFDASPSSRGGARVPAGRHSLRAQGRAAAAGQGRIQPRRPGRSRRRRRPPLSQFSGLSWAASTVRAHGAPAGRSGPTPASGAPVQVPPSLGAGPPARARIKPPPRGRTASNPGARSAAPRPASVVLPRRAPPPGRFTLPRRGVCRQSGGTRLRTGRSPRRNLSAPRARYGSGSRFRRGAGPTGNPGGPVRNPDPGPVFRQAVRPIQGIIPRNAPRGRVGSTRADTIENMPNIQAILIAGQTSHPVEHRARFSSCAWQQSPHTSSVEGALSGTKTQALLVSASLPPVHRGPGRRPDAQQGRL